MDEHRATGTARQVGGKIEEGLGRVTGDTSSQIRGVFEQAQGSAEKLYGEAKEAAGEAAQGVRTAAVSFEDIIRTTIEERPYTAAAIALGIGWLLGRTHRPL
jgi:uncharacterized protein YjbJ (UPF0337 family)